MEGTSRGINQRLRGEPISIRSPAPYAILDARLTGRTFLLSASYTIVDMAAWGWARLVPYILGDDAWSALPNLKRWFDDISARPAAVRASALKDRYNLKTDMDEEARRHLFRHLQEQW